MPAEPATIRTTRLRAQPNRTVVDASAAGFGALTVPPPRCTTATVRASVAIGLLCSACFTPVGEPPPLPTARRCLGTGQFTLASAQDAGLVMGAATGDFNEDGRPDAVIVALEAGHSRLTLLRGQGTGALETPESIEVIVGYAQTLVAADVDADGHLDLLELVQSDASSTEVVGELRVLRGMGTGRFRDAQTRAVGFRPAALVVGDFDGDHTQDVAVANFGLCFDFEALPSSLQVLWGQGNGTFADGPVFRDDRQWQFLAAGDLDGDGRSDLAATARRWVEDGGCAASGGVRSLETFRSEGRALRPSHTPRNGNSDGPLAIVPVSGAAPSIAMVSWGAEIFRPDAGEYVSVQTFGWQPRFVFNDSAFAADFDGDGRLDVVAPQLFEPLVSVFRGRSDGTFEPSIDTRNAPSTSRFAIPADFDNDGAPDLFTVDIEGGGAVQVLHNQCR